LESRPELYDDLLPAWNAFNTLHSARGSGLGGEPLRVSDITAWLDVYDIAGEERTELFELIRVLDDVWLDHIRTELKEKTDADPPHSNRRKRRNRRR
jgi:hypothetical protein